MKRGIFTIDDKAYFQKVDAISNSSLSLIKESVLHFENAKLFAPEGKPLVLGSAVHTLILEPHLFEERYAVEDFEGCHLNKNSNAYKDARRVWLESTEGKSILSEDDYRQVKKKADMVRALDEKVGLLQGGIAEAAVFSEFDGIPVRSKLDYINFKYKVIVDVKTTASVSKFRSSIKEYSYHRQQAFYKDILMNEVDDSSEWKFVFIVVDANMVRYLQLDQRSEEEGRAEYTKLISEWKDYKKNGHINLIKGTSLPEWYWRSIQVDA